MYSFTSDVNSALCTLSTLLEKINELLSFHCNIIITYITQYSTRVRKHSNDRPASLKDIIEGKDWKQSYEPGKLRLPLLFLLLLFNAVLTSCKLVWKSERSIKVFYTNPAMVWSGSRPLLYGWLHFGLLIQNPRVVVSVSKMLEVT